MGDIFTSTSDLLKGENISEHDPDGDFDRSQERRGPPEPWKIMGQGHSVAVPALDRLCRSMVAQLGGDGASVVLMAPGGSEITLASSDSSAREVAELEFSLGEGPNHDAFVGARLVLIPDMSGAAIRWPAYAAAAVESGVGAAFVFPLQIGAARLGVLALYFRAAKRLSQEQLNASLSFAALATELLVDSLAPVADSARSLDHQGPQEFRGEVYQAQGMVMVSLGVGLGEALSRMRAHAFAAGQDLTQLSADIVAGDVRLPDDRN